MTFKEFSQFILNGAYIWFWFFRQWLRRFVSRGSKSLLLAASAFLLLEIVVEVVHVAHWDKPLLERIASHPALDSEELSASVEQVTKWAGITFLAAAVLLFGRNLREVREHHRQAIFVESAVRVVACLEELVFGDEPIEEGQERLRTCITAILDVLLKTFAGRQKLNINVMVMKLDGLLHMEYVEAAPGTKYAASYRPKAGPEGGGVGMCFEKQAIIYFPDVRRRHAISIKYFKGQPLPDRRVHLNLYFPVNPEPYRASLCVPVLADKLCFGVLNVDCGKKDPFVGLDYLTLTFFGWILGLAFARFYARYERSKLNEFP